MFFLACPSKYLGQSGRILSSLLLVVNCKVPYASAFPSTLPSPFGLDLEFPEDSILFIT